jgi:ABC-2 type transport system permease protein
VINKLTVLNNYTFIEGKKKNRIKQIIRRHKQILTIQRVSIPIKLDLNLLDKIYFYTRNMLAIIRKEISYFFSSLVGMVVLMTFLLVNALFLWTVPINDYLNIVSSGYASLEPLFTLAPWMYLILIPALTMHSLTEEKSSGTLELIITKPVSNKSLVTAKFIASNIILILTLIPTLLYVGSVHFLAYPQGNIDTGAILGSYLGLVLLGSSFIAIGIFSSSLANNQIVSLMLSIVLCIFFYLGFDWIASFGTENTTAFLIKQFGIQEHYNSISRGLLDTRDLVYYIALIVFFLALSELKLSSRKW